MSKETQHALETLLEGVTSSRRKLLKQLLIGGGILALTPTSALLAQPAGAEEQERHRPGKGKHKGWRKGKHKGWRKGKGKAKGKGKGKGKGRG